jgi:hypothetical protein
MTAARCCRVIELCILVKVGRWSVLSTRVDVHCNTVQKD